MPQLVLKGILSLAALWARREDYLCYTLCSQVLQEHEVGRVEWKCCCNPVLPVVEIQACFALCKSLRMINWGKAWDEVCLWSRPRHLQFFLSVFGTLSFCLLPLSLSNAELSLNPCEWIICPFATYVQMISPARVWTSGPLAAEGQICLDLCRNISSPCPPQFTISLTPISQMSDFQVRASLLWLSE